MKKMISKDKWEEFVRKIEELPDDAIYKIEKIEHYVNGVKDEDYIPLYSYHIITLSKYYNKEKFQWLWLCKENDIEWNKIPIARVLKDFRFTDDTIEILVEGEYLQFLKYSAPFRTKIIFKKCKEGSMN